MHASEKLSPATSSAALPCSAPAAGVSGPPRPPTSRPETCRKIQNPVRKLYRPRPPDQEERRQTLTSGLRIGIGPVYRLAEKLKRISGRYHRSGLMYRQFRDDFSLSCKNVR